MGFPDDIGQSLMRGVVVAVIIAFLAGAGCVGLGAAVWWYFPYRVQVVGR